MIRLLIVGVMLAAPGICAAGDLAHPTDKCPKGYVTKEKKRYLEFSVPPVFTHKSTDKFKVCEPLKDRGASEATRKKKR